MPREIVTPHLKLFCASMGKVFRVTHIATSQAAANAFMERHPETALIAEEGGLCILANKYGPTVPSGPMKDLLTGY